MVCRIFGENIDAEISGNYKIFITYKNVLDKISLPSQGDRVIDLG